MLTEEDRADAYRQMTDSTRHLLRVARDDARQWQRVKPDPEVHPLAGFDCEKEPTRVSQPAQPTLQRACTSAQW
jgi:hypothetical protein